MPRPNLVASFAGQIVLATIQVTNAGETLTGGTANELIYGFVGNGWLLGLGGDGALFDVPEMTRRSSYIPAS